MSLLDQSLDAGFVATTDLDADPFNAGVASLKYAWTTLVSGGTSLARTASSGETFLAYDSVPEPAGALFLACGLVGVGARRQLR